MTDPWCCYTWWHGSHQYTPVMLAYIPAPWILWVGEIWGSDEPRWSHRFLVAFPPSRQVKNSRVLSPVPRHSEKVLPRPTQIPKETLHHRFVASKKNTFFEWSPPTDILTYILTFWHWHESRCAPLHPELAIGFSGSIGAHSHEELTEEEGRGRAEWRRREEEEGRKKHCTFVKI